MGVKDLWAIILPVQKKKSLAELKGKLIVVDLGIWVVQSKKCSGLNHCRKPHLRNIFFRASYLLTHGIRLVFVTEGEAPELKLKTIQKRLKLQDVSNPDSDAILSRKTFQRTLKECAKLLQYMGVPCLKSPGEAESYCAFLNAQGIVDGCVTEDSDVFLYGARTVYRDFTICPQDAHVFEFTMDDIESKLELHQVKLVALALLLGCDYSEGVDGIGEKTALNFLKEMKNRDVLKRFKQWAELPPSELFPSYDFNQKKNVSHCERCHHPGTKNQHNRQGCNFCQSDFTCYLQKRKCPCDWHKNLEEKDKIENELKIYGRVKNKGDFPDQNVIDEFLKRSNEVPDENDLSWLRPDLTLFQADAVDWFGWSLEESTMKLLPIITCWQITQLSNNSTTSDITKFPFEPLRILKTQKKRFQNYYLVKWERKDDNPDELNLQTLEHQTDFDKAYPTVASQFKKEKKMEAEKKEMEKKEKRKAKSTKSKRTRAQSKQISSTPCQKLTVLDFFTPTKETPKVETVKKLEKCDEEHFQESKIILFDSSKCLSPVNFSVMDKLRVSDEDSYKSESSFLDVPLSMRLPLKSVIPKNVNPASEKSLCGTPRLSNRLSVNTKAVNHCDNINSNTPRSILSLVLSSKTSMDHLETSERSLKNDSFLNIVSNVSFGSAGQKLLYSLSKSDSFEINLATNACTSTPNIESGSNVNLARLISHPILRLGNSFFEDESCDLFPSANSSRQTDDSVVCLN